MAAVNEEETGGSGTAHWIPEPALHIDRDLTAIVLAIMNDGTIRDYAELVGDEERLAAMLLRACQYIAQLYLALAHNATKSDDPGVAMAVARDLLQRALLTYAAGGNPFTEYASDQEDDVTDDEY